VSIAIPARHEPGNDRPGSLGTARSQHTATLMTNGKVLVTGGSGENHLRRSELYDPAAGIWKSTGGLLRKRVRPTATLLHNGMVLEVGGSRGRRTELYDPMRESWIATGSLVTNHFEGHTATLLPGGDVMVAGGYFVGVNVQLYDPGSETWTETGSLATERQHHTATLLPDGKVLIAGGADNNFNALASAELGVPLE